MSPTVAGVISKEGSVRIATPPLRSRSSIQRFPCNLHPCPQSWPEHLSSALLLWPLVWGFPSSTSITERLCAARWTESDLKENQKKAFINIHRKPFFHDPILLRGRNFEIRRHLVTNLILAYMWLFNKYLLN